MTTNVHLPNNHFLIISGMTKNVSTESNSGPPCLGSLPIIGSLFKRKEKNVDRSSLLIFVKPQIIHSTQQYKTISNQLSNYTDLTLNKNYTN